MPKHKTDQLRPGAAQCAAEGSTTYLRNALNVPSYGENAFMNTRDNLANASLDTSLLSELCNIFSAFANDDASVFCAHQSTQSEGVPGRFRTGIRTRRS